MESAAETQAHFLRTGPWPRLAWRGAERSKVRAYLAAERIPGQLLHHDKAMWWLGREWGATAVLVAQTHAQGGNLRVEMRLLAGDKNKAGPLEGWSLPGGASAARLQPVESFPKEGRYSSPRTRKEFSGSIKRIGSRLCPAPSDTDAARKQRVPGLILLHGVVGSDGEGESATILRGQPFGRNEVAANAITKGWQFDPGTKDGQPVRVQVQIEMDFRL